MYRYSNVICSSFSLPCPAYDETFNLPFTCFLFITVYYHVILSITNTTSLSVNVFSRQPIMSLIDSCHKIEYNISHSGPFILTNLIYSFLLSPSCYPSSLFPSLPSFPSILSYSPPPLLPFVMVPTRFSILQVSTRSLYTAPLATN